MVEILSDNNIFEQNKYKEIERKFIPLLPEQFVEFRQHSMAIEQFYVSHPSEEFSLRLREAPSEDGSLQYRATLKDRGAITSEGLSRLEIETDVSSELYRYYHSDVPTIRKLRAHIEGIEIDFFEDGHIHLEAEDQDAWERFTNTHGDQFLDMTGSPVVDNEWRAHRNYRNEHGGGDALKPLPELDCDAIVRDIQERHVSSTPTFVKIRGRSGSGKSTIVRSLQEKLAMYGLTSDVISTDDYHRGTQWLQQYNDGQPWTDWDAEIVYDTAEMARTLACLQEGRSAPRRTIDWSTVEPFTNGEIEPSSVIIIEGIYAGHTDFDTLNALGYDMPTPLATCIGRRLLRDLRERPQFADPEASLKYMLEHAEPAWRAQQK